MPNIPSSAKRKTQKAKCYVCGYEWETRAKRTIYIRCPNCLREISREKAINPKNTN
ncbi:MAG: hypothetical protein QXV17_06830 [Candidatus Micrarchaeaceae archaeon]